MVVVDMQVHVWRPLRPGEQWKSSQRPHLAEALEAEKLLALMDEAGVGRAVLVPPIYVGFDNSYCLEAARRWPDRFAVMGRLDPTTPEAPAQLATWLDQPGMLALRWAVPFEPERQWLVDGTLDWTWPELERLDIPTAVYAPGLTRHLGPIAARHPRLKLIVDHLALPLPPVPDPFADLGEVLDLAQYPNVYVKTSSLPLYSKEPYPFRDLCPQIRRVHDAFGPQRMLWAADVSRAKGGYRETMAYLGEACDFLSDEDLSWILGGTAIKLLRWQV